MSTKKSSKLPLILCVDDEKGVINFLRTRLRMEGYKVLVAYKGDKGLQLAEEQKPDLIIMDLQMPEMDGYQVLQQIRVFSMVPVIIITSKEDDIYEVKAFELGADDFIRKPFHPENICLRVKSLLKRCANQEVKEAVSAYKKGNVRIDFVHREAIVGKEQLKLSRTEWSLLEELARHAGEPQTAKQLLVNVWGPEYRDDNEYLRVWISRLRHKFEEDPSDPKIIMYLSKNRYMMVPGN